jgi:hypothetical protein
VDAVTMPAPSMGRPYWQADCRMCGWKQLHETEANASQAMKAHRCPTGKQSAGMVSMVQGPRGSGLPRELGVDLGTEEAITEDDRTEAIERQRHIEEALGE